MKFSRSDEKKLQKVKEEKDAMKDAEEEKKDAKDEKKKEGLRMPLCPVIL